MADALYWIAGALSGGLVGFVLGLVGGGGSILAVPLMVYVVGVSSPHVAIGTSALAVAVNAFASLVNHARAGAVKWPCGMVFTAAGILGALAGSTLGKNFDGQKLLFLFALLMMAIAVLMLRRSRKEDDADVRLGKDNAPRLIGTGAGTGLLSGFFGIGGGFLIVPSLLASTHMPMINAVATSLVAVTAFGLATAGNYALSGYVDWLLAAVFIGGGVIGTIAGAAVSRRLTGKDTLRRIFAVIVIATALYMLWQSALAM